MEENKLTLESLIKKQKEQTEIEAQKLIDRQRAAAIASVSGIAQQPAKDFYNVPDSTASNLIMETLEAGENIVDLPARKRQINHNTTYEVLQNGKKREVRLTNSKAEVTIELADIDRLTGSNKPAKKLFVLALIKANEQAIFNGQLTKDYISFSIQELVDIGFYKTPQSARVGFNRGMETLTSLKVKGHIQISNKHKAPQDELQVLFTGSRIENGQCTIFFNSRINWSFIAQYFTILPLYYFKLSNRASDLLYYIFYLARQHTKDIDERGYFNIGFRAIQSKLQLPSEKTTKNPKRDIQDPIDEAIEELETEHSAQYGNMEFKLLPVYDEKSSIAGYLDNGYLKVTLEGNFAKAFVQISRDTAKRIERTEKRQERIAEKAIAIKNAKAMKKNKDNT